MTIRRTLLTTVVVGSIVAGTAALTVPFANAATSSSGGQIVAPYVDMGLYPPADLVAVSSAMGVKALSLAFVVQDASAPCSPAWGGYNAYSVGGAGDFSGAIAAFKAVGGQPIVSFGGASGTELADGCSSTTAVTTAYQKVIDRYGIDRVDFDIEGAAVATPAGNQRRAAAVAQVQKDMAAKGKSLAVSLTLPVMPDGLTADGLRTVREFVSAGVTVSTINVMAMDYGSSYTDMGTHAITAIQTTAAQLKAIPAYSSWSDAQRTALVGVTPMIGKNDVAPEVFTISDTAKVAQYARANGVGFVGWWEVTRDKPCTGGSNSLYMCTGTSEAQWAYSRAFVAGLGGSVAPLPSVTPSASTTVKPTATPTAPTSNGVTVKSTITTDWGTGFCANVDVTATSASPITWSVTQPIAGTVASFWNSAASGTSTKVFTGAAWNSTVSSTTPTSFGYCADRVAGVTPTATPTLTPTPTATPTPTPTPTPTQSTVSPSPTATPSSSQGLSVKVGISSDWGSGRTVAVVVRNTGTAAVNGWSITMPWQGTNVSPWDAVGSAKNGSLTMTNAAWNGQIPAGGSVTFGFTDAGAASAPASCTATVGGTATPCRIG